MSQSDEQSCVVIAVTDSCPVQRLWEAAMHHAAGNRMKVVALYITDERWHRAASLPFTCEISRIGGDTVNFTKGRAEQVLRDTAEQARRQMQRLASESELAIAFKVLSRPDPQKIKTLMGSARNVLVAPTVLEKQPVYAHFEQLVWRIELIETSEGSDESR